MKLSLYAKQQGIRYRTALRWFRDGTIQGYQAPSGTIIVTKQEPAQVAQKVAIYARLFFRAARELGAASATVEPVLYGAWLSGGASSERDCFRGE